MHSLLTKAAAVELQARRSARSSLQDFVRWTMPHYVEGPHHAIISDALVRATKTKHSRIMLMAPPRHGKSQFVSRHFPAWYLGNHPTKQLIISSYSQDLANDFGRDIRTLIDMPEYHRLFGVSLDETSRSVNRFHTNHGGVLHAVGVGASITGRGADFCIIDDPIKNRQEADSANNRRDVWAWYTSTLYTRLMPGASLVLMMTRWHEDDLAGRLISEMEKGGEQWEIIRLPAITGEGTSGEKALWPEWYTLDDLHRIRRSIGPRDWSALYQQQPSSDEGAYFKSDWLKFIQREELPIRLTHYITFDAAVTSHGGDYTAITVWGVSPDGHIYGIDGWRGRESPDVWVDALLSLVRRYRPIQAYSEAGIIRRAIEPILAKRMRETSTYCSTEYIPSVTDKEARARGFQSRCAIGAVSFLDTPYFRAMQEELIKFPAARNDDLVDTCSLIGQRIQMLYGARGEEQTKHLKRDYGMLFGDTPDTWRTV